MDKQQFDLKRRDTKTFSALVHLVYEAGLNPAKWNDVVAAIATSFGTSKALLFTPYVAPQHGGLIFPAGISEATLQLWGSSYIEHDIWSQQVEKQGLWRNGAVFLDEQMVPHQEFLQSRFYKEFLKGINIGRVCTGVVFENSPGLMAMSLAVFRDVDDPAFDKDDLQWMKLLVAHVSRSLGVMQRLDTARLRYTSLLSSFDRLAFGVVLLDADMQVLHCNTAAKAGLDRNDGLMLNASNQLDGGGVPKSGSRLAQWLLTLKNTPPEQQVHFLDGFVVARKNKRQHYVVQCSAIAEADAWKVGNNQACFVAFITDPSAQLLPAASRLMQHYDLTRTQGPGGSCLCPGLYL